VTGNENETNEKKTSKQKTEGTNAELLFFNHTRPFFYFPVLPTFIFLFVSECDDFSFWGRSSRWVLDKRANDCLCETEKEKAQQRPINKAAAGERM
jgi:hypothetical protein